MRSAPASFRPAAADVAGPISDGGESPPNGVEDLLRQRQRHGSALYAPQVDAGDFGGWTSPRRPSRVIRPSLPAPSSSRLTRSARHRARRPTSPNSRIVSNETGRYVTSVESSSDSAGIAAAKVCSAASSITGMNSKTPMRQSPHRAGRSQSPQNRWASERSASTRRRPARDVHRCVATRRRSRRVTRQFRLLRTLTNRLLRRRHRAARPRRGRPHAGTNCRPLSGNGSRRGCSSSALRMSCVVTRVSAAQRQHLLDLEPIHHNGVDRQTKRFATGSQHHLGEIRRRHDGWPCTL